MRHYLCHHLLFKEKPAYRESILEVLITAHIHLEFNDLIGEMGPAAIFERACILFQYEYLSFTGSLNSNWVLAHRTLSWALHHQVFFCRPQMLSAFST